MTITGTIQAYDHWHDGGMVSEPDTNWGPVDIFEMIQGTPELFKDTKEKE